MKILDTKRLVQANDKIFLGEYSGFQRFDVYQFPFAKAIEEKMRNAFWNPAEVSLVADRLKFPSLPDHIQDILTSNILFQTVMDSSQSRGLEAVLCAITTSPEWEAVFKTQAYFEQIHSLTYSHILREVYPDATAVFDSIEDIDEIKSRVEDEVRCYDSFSSLAYETANEEDKKKMILELLVRIYALEGVKFYVSFLVTYTINNSYANAIQGTAREIKLINFDEDLHVSVFAGLLGILRKNKSQGFVELMDSVWFENMVRDVFKKVVRDEISWGRFLLDKGPVPTLTPQIIDKFVKYYANLRVGQIKQPELYKNITKNDIIQWFETYKNIDLDNVAGQEGEGLAYNVGIMKDDLGDDEWEDLA